MHTTPNPPTGPERGFLRLPFPGATGSPVPKPAAPAAKNPRFGVLECAISAETKRPGLHRIGRGRAMLPDSNAQIRKLLEERILIIDGAMGTMVQRYKLEEA